MKAHLLLSLCLLVNVYRADASVLLMYFTAESVNGNAQLQWSTGSEYNNAMFFVERSVNASEWQAVQSLNGSGNSTIEVQYETVDYNPGTGNKYYRLRQMDANGLCAYSEVINVHIVPGPPSSFSVFPNPASDEIAVEVDKTWVGKICVVNAIGQTMVQEVRVEGSPLKMNVDDLPKGMYYVQFQNENEKVMKKFYKE